MAETIECAKDRELHEVFESLVESGRDYITTTALKDHLEERGLASSLIKQAVKQLDPDNTRKIYLEQFKHLKEMHTDIIERALKGQLVIPDFEAFTNDLEQIFNEVKKNENGHPATYIPQLARADPNWFGVTVFTVDGQVRSFGDVEHQFTIQSCSKPITYACAETILGVDVIKKHVGHEPSGVKFNAFQLNDQQIPHNPMINAGAIMTASLLRPDLEPADRFDYVLSVWKRLAGDSSVGFDNATYLSELRTADRNFALAYFMKDAGAFPESVRTAEDVQRTLEFYFQCCSILGTCESMASAAATLANGGIHPITQEHIFTPETVRNTLSLMFSCGMYDYSGEFAYSIGLPAKSGVAGCVLVVVPNLFGLCIWSPPLDKQGNSVRGVDFCTRLTAQYAFHVFDTVTVAGHKKDPRRKASTDEGANTGNVSEMCYAAASGDLARLRQLFLAGVPVNIADYDYRTPMHLAACEGHAHITEWLLGMGANPAPRDRWGATPLDDARTKGHTAVIELLDGRA